MQLTVRTKDNWGGNDIGEAKRRRYEGAEACLGKEVATSLEREKEGVLDDRMGGGSQKEMSSRGWAGRQWP